MYLLLTDFSKLPSFMYATESGTSIMGFKPEPSPPMRYIKMRWWYYSKCWEKKAFRLQHLSCRRFEERCVLPVLPCCELERVLVWIVTYNNSFQLTSPLPQWSSQGSHCVSAAGREMAPHGGGGTFVQLPPGVLGLATVRSPSPHKSGSKLAIEKSLWLTLETWFPNHVLQFHLLR